MKLIHKLGQQIKCVVDIKKIVTSAPADHGHKEWNTVTLTGICMAFQCDNYWECSCVTDWVHECYQVINCFYLYQVLQCSCSGFKVMLHSNRIYKTCITIMDNIVSKKRS
jgi:hypothetical protein